MSALCSRCRTAEPRPGQKICNPCHAAYMREWRKTHPLNSAHKKRDTARSYANQYKRRGRLPVECCKVCGSPDAEMHHPNHELPLFVVWLCRPHHLAWHSHWRDAVLNVFGEWLAVAQACEAVRREEEAAPQKIERAA